MTIISDIDDFHQKFGFTKRVIGEKPDLALLQFRLKFLCEELFEMQTDARKNDLAGVLDALVDLVYVAVGSAWLLNLDFEGAWKLVHAANMAKVRATSDTVSKRGTTLDVVKPAGWTAPQISQVLDQRDNLLLHQAVAPEQNAQIDIFEYLQTLRGAE